MHIPTFQEVRRAREVIAPYLRPTPLLAFGALSRALGCQAYLKCENLQPVGAFKVRSGINLSQPLIRSLVEDGLRPDTSGTGEP